MRRNALLRSVYMRCTRCAHQAGQMTWQHGRKVRRLLTERGEGCIVRFRRAYSLQWRASA
jgi:hypothetical protein